MIDEHRQETMELTHDTAHGQSQLSDGEERFVSAVEALLFAAHEPLAPSMLMSLDGRTGWTLDDVAGEINRRLSAHRHPMRVRKVAGGYQMHLLPEFAPIVDAHLVREKTQKLSRAGLETLAIIAYRQPCSTPEVEHIRGVACDGVLRTLMERGLITLKGRSDAPGRPWLYTTTREFLQYFGIDALADLPPETELASILASRNPDDSDPTADLFARLVLKRNEGECRSSTITAETFRIGDVRWSGNHDETDSESDEDAGVAESGYEQQDVGLQRGAESLVTAPA
ncbi:MAG TPA: SMC-Scp complex subunit ScpB [candidate division Zixibacteria bacterium]|jgi:segregation and condensation protein B